jgi:arylsulfatase A-like enzyme
MKNTRFIRLAAVAAALFVLPFAAQAAKPNIVWIFVEDMNGWYGCYGDTTVPTPNIDRMAKEGVRFNRMYTPAGVCSATRSATALGAMQTTYGVHQHRSSRKRVPEEVINLPDGVKTVYEHLRAGGYYTISSKGKNDFNFEFDMNALYDDLFKVPMGFATPDWNQRPEGKPFFAQIQLKGGKNNGRYEGSAPLPEPEPGKKKKRGFKPPAKIFTSVEAMQDKIPPYYPNVPIIREEYAHHYDTVRQTDDEVGLILAALEKDKLLDNTVVFFWTDHGMRLHRHKQWLYEGGVNMPLLVMGPGIKKGQVRDDLVSGIDISATTLALAGIPIPKSFEAQDFFAPGFKRDYVVSARDRCDYTIEHVRAITTKRFKYIRNFLTDRPFMQPQYRDGRPYIEIPRQLYKDGKMTAAQAFWWQEKRVGEEFYDLENDPHEVKNLASDPAFVAELKRHQQLLATWMKETDDKGQYPESADSLRGVYKQWKDRCVNPEYDKVK